MTASNAASPPGSGADRARLEDLFRGFGPTRSAEELAREGVFDDGEVEQFLTDLSALRHADLG